MKVVVIGAGCVGLVSDACFAEFSNAVVAVDTDDAKITGLREGHSPIYELSLGKLVQDNMVEWNEFHAISPAQRKALMHGDVVVDSGLRCQGSGCP